MLCACYRAAAQNSQFQQTLEADARHTYKSQPPLPGLYWFAYSSAFRMHTLSLTSSTLRLLGCVCLFRETSNKVGLLTLPSLRRMGSVCQTEIDVSTPVSTRSQPAPDTCMSSLTLTYIRAHLKFLLCAEFVGEDLCRQEVCRRCHKAALPQGIMGRQSA